MEELLHSDEALAAIAASPLIAGSGLLILGGLIGAIITCIFQMRLIEHVPFPGSSLILMPLARGFVMNQYGGNRSNAGRKTPFFAIFGGGALFAFGLAAVRLVMISRFV
jgi:hypothetical protein